MMPVRESYKLGEAKVYTMMPVRASCKLGEAKVSTMMTSIV